jgi:hypothetical protein
MYHYIFNVIATKQFRSRDRLAGIATGYEIARVQFLAAAQEFSPSQSVQTDPLSLLSHGYVG